MNKKKIVVSVLGILGIVLATIGVTYAFFSYSKTGTIDNTITSGSINFKYTEGNRKIELDELMPMTDDQGKALSNYFDFDISAKTSRTVDIPYDITVRKATGENILPDNIIKVYLTKVVNGVEEDILLDTADHLNGYSNSKINIPASEKLLYTSKVSAGDTNYSVSYRLRMWISTSASYIDQTGQTDQYPLEGKSYSLTVNVYGEGLDIGESGVATRQNTNIQSIAFSDSGDNFTLENGVYTSEAVMPEGETTITKTIVVTTENPNATATYQKVDETGMIIPDTGIKRLSTSLNLPLTLGTNNFIITVKGEDNRTTHQYNLRIDVHSAQPFRDDSWATIQYNVIHNNIDRYTVGDTRTIELGNDLGTHTLRLANKTACTTETSETACGFVVEFTDQIGSKGMSSYPSSNVGGYPGSQVFNYVTNTIYNALPSDLKAVMLDTTVVSSHGSDLSNPNNLETDSNNNFIIRNQKIYLLDKYEIFGDYYSNEYNSAAGTTRQLDYYIINKQISSRIKLYAGIEQTWWTRSCESDSSTTYYSVLGNGGQATSTAHGQNGVSPAFRIG